MDAASVYVDSFRALIRRLQIDDPSMLHVQWGSYMLNPAALIESPADPAGIRCDAEWCMAFDRADQPCGDAWGHYVGLVHANRAARAEARDRGDPYESGLLFAGEGGWHEATEALTGAGEGETTAP